MKKRICALALALALTLSVPAVAAQDSADNFVRSRTYSGQFADLPGKKVIKWSFSPASSKENPRACRTLRRTD